MSYFTLKNISFDLTGDEQLFNLITYEHWHEYLIQHNVQQTLLEVVNLSQGLEINIDMRLEVEIGQVQYMLAYYPSKALFRLGSKQLSDELTLLSLQEQHQGSDFKVHVEEIAQIPSSHTPLVIERVRHRYQLANLESENFYRVQELTYKLMEELSSQMKEYKPVLFERLSDFGLNLTANYELIRVHLLKFLATLPCLDHDVEGHEVKKVFLESIRRLIDDSLLAKNLQLKEQKRALPDGYIRLCQILLFLSSKCPARSLAFLIRKSVSYMAKRFIAGESIEKVSGALKGLHKSGRDATFDQLGELVVSADEADEYKAGVLKIIRGLASHIPRGTTNKAGLLKAHVSIKVSALGHDFKPQAYEYTYEQVAPRLKEILIEAHKERVFVNIDAEHYHFRDLVFKIYQQVLLETDELADYADTGIVLQAYLRDAAQHFNEILLLAQKRKIPMPIRLVKGAYWDAETIEASAHNFIAPQFLNKEESDLNFRHLVFETLKHGDDLQLALASHNIQDHCYALALHKELFSKAPIIEHQCLHMTYEALSCALAQMDLPVRNYIPVGNLLVGMAYLVRRIMENSSQVGVLTMMRSHKKKMVYTSALNTLKQMHQDSIYTYDEEVASFKREFRNIYPLRSYLPHHLKALQKSLDYEMEKAKNFSQAYFEQEGVQKVVSSSDPSLVLGEVKWNSTKEVDEMMEQMFISFNQHSWCSDIALRATSLLRLAQFLLQERERLSAIIMLEAGKSLEEAIGDVDEAYDFIAFYVRKQIELVQSSREELAARGIIGVIAPWNFPLAIPCGMAIAPLMAGNCVLLKPAEQTSLIAREFIQLAYKAGVPRDVFKICYGAGEIGAHIVSHELTSGIVFTGSKAVGVSIYSKIKQQLTSRRYSFAPISKVAITEMGGKNAIIVTNNCELDETISGILYSAFAHSGQKCSAASRIIVDKKILQAFKVRFVKAVHDLKVAGSYDFSCMLNPLIGEEDQQRVRQMAKLAKKEVEEFSGSVWIDRSEEEYTGYCVGPSVFELPAKRAMEKMSLAQQEVFGPLVHIIPFEDLDEAINIFNSTDYALTGGIYAQSQDDIDYLGSKIECGNIYINRPNTGARVAIEPFGGFKMSGTGPKAATDYYMWKFNRIVTKSESRGPIKHLRDFDEDKFFFPNNSGRSIEQRMNMAYLFLQMLADQLEPLINEVNEPLKDYLFEIQGGIEEGKTNIVERSFPNRNIPGQMSFDKKDLPLGQMLLIIESEKLHRHCLSYVVMGIIVGNGISIACTSQEAHRLWSKLWELLKQSGVSDYNFQVCLVGDKTLSSLLKMPYHLVIVDDDLKEVNNLQKMALKQSFPHFLRAIQYTDESSLTIDRLLDELTIARSYAINTMRHGASLETGLAYEQN